MTQTASNTGLGPILATAEWILVFALLGLFGIRALFPAWHSLNTDFPNYYLTALLRSQGEPVDRAYEWLWFQRQKDHSQIPQPLVSFAPHPPLCAVPMLPLTSLPPLAAKRVWILLNLAFLSAALYVLHCVTQLRWRHILAIAGLCVLPLRSNFVFGQYYVVILLLLSLAFFAVFRGHRFTAGTLLACAAWFKVFPAFFFLLFLRKRDWRAFAGLLVGALVFATGSVLIFGLDIHRVWLFEVLPSAVRGDIVDPYDMQLGSFSAVWRHLFLFEPELNPSPFFSSPAIFAIAQALTSATLLFSFLFSTSRSSTDRTTAWEWSAFTCLLLLLSSMPVSYHYVVLIFTVIVGVDVMVRAGRGRAALLMVFLYALACAPVTTAGLFVLRRMLATLALYVVLLWNAPARAPRAERKVFWALAGTLFVVVATLSQHTLKKQREDFSLRPAQKKSGYASFSPVATTSGIAVIEMVESGYRPATISDGRLIPVSAAGDVLSIAAGGRAPFVYFEVVDQGSHIVRLASDQVGRSDALSEFVTEGQQPSISYDGRWLAVLRENHGRTEICILRDGRLTEKIKVFQDLPRVLEMSVMTEGDVVAAVDGAASPHLVLLRLSTGESRPLREIAGAVRYPAVSPDSARLAFSRREFGSWHLFVRDFSTGMERRLTEGACNATSPAWEDSHTVLYATDCARGYGLNAIARIALDN